MSVDICSVIEIERGCTEVAAFASNPANASAWYVNIKAVEWKTEPTAKVGSRVAFVAQFLGKRLSYTYEVTAFVPGERLVMQTAEGPFPMENTYEWESISSHRTRMTLRNRGSPAGFSRWLSPFMTWSIRHANKMDLQRLKQLVELK